MNIQKLLEQQLKEVELEISNTGASEKRALLQIAKSNILTALQKYEGDYRFTNAQNNDIL